MSQLETPFAVTWYNEDRRRWVCDLHLSPTENAIRAFSRNGGARAIDNALAIRMEHLYYPLRTGHPMQDAILNHLGPRWKYAAADWPYFCIWGVEKAYREGTK